MPAPRVVHRTAMGGLVWALPGSTLQIMWSGPGARLRIGQPMKPGGSVSFIEHPSADGAYDSSKAATAAVKRFIAAGDPIQQTLRLGNTRRTRGRW